MYRITKYYITNGEKALEKQYVKVRIKSLDFTRISKYQVEFKWE